MLATESARSLRGQRRPGEPIGAIKLRLSPLTIGVAMIATVGFFGCSDQSGNVNQLNQNEFALRGMIASDRQQIDALQAQLRQTQDEVAELKHNGAPSAGAAAPADVNERLAKLESEVNAMQVAMPSPPVGAEAPPPPGVAPAPPPPTTAGVGAAPSAPGAAAPAGSAAEPAPTWPEDVDKEIASTQSSKDPGAKIYRKGLDAMKAGNYPVAIVQFAKIKNSYPKSPLSEPSQ